MMKLLTFSTLYPSTVRPNHGIFVETRLRNLIASGEAQAVVVAPVPWFPFRHSRFGEYSKFACTPDEEVLNGIRVLHPRYLLLPKMGMSIAPFLLALGTRSALAQLRDEGYDFDLIDAHYFYPDGVAAVLLGKYFSKPVIVTARGSDINVFPKFRIPRALLQWAAQRTAANVTVCQALKDSMIALGIHADRIVPLRNGVDLERFKPIDRAAGRRDFKISAYTLLSVGNLVPGKGHHIVIESLSLMPDVHLLIAGHGPQRDEYEQLARDLGVSERVRFLGSVPQHELKNYYGAVDALVLASASEGWPNVLLEVMACGTPALASNVSGIPEILTAPAAGALLHERTPKGVARAVETLRKNVPDHAATRRYAEQFSWEETTQGQLALFRQVLNRTPLTQAHHA